MRNFCTISNLQRYKIDNTYKIINVLSIKMNTHNNLFDFYKLKTWIEPKRILWSKLVTRENAIPFVEKHIDLLDHHSLEKLSRNPFAVEMLKNRVDKIKWNDFVYNPNAMHVIDKHFDICVKELNSYGRINLLRHPNFVHIIETHEEKIIDELLNSNSVFVFAQSRNQTYIDLLEKFMQKYPEKITSDFWCNLCDNPLAIHIIEQNLHKLNNSALQILAKNPKAIHIIRENLDKLDDTGWRYLCENPNAIPLLEEQPDRINWCSLSCNINGIAILEKNPEKIACYLFFDYDNIYVNAPIFELDYDVIEKRCAIYKEELMQVALHPSRIESYLQQGISIEELDNYI